LKPRALARGVFITISKIEAGKAKNPTIGTLSKLADVFEVSIDELVGRK